MQVTSVEERITELEEKVEELEGVIKGSNDTIKTQQEALEVLAKDWLWVCEYLGFIPQHGTLPDSHQTNVTNIRQDEVSDPSVPVLASIKSVSASLTQPDEVKVPKLVEATQDKLTAFDNEPSAEKPTEAGVPTSSPASMPRVVLIPPTPQTSQEAVGYAKVPLVIPSSPGMEDQPEGGVKNIPGDSHEANSSANTDTPTNANHLVNSEEFLTGTEGEAPGLKLRPTVFEPGQLLAPPSNAKLLSPVP